MSNKFNFTMNKLRVIKPSEKRVIYYDLGQPGLRMLVTPTGNKTFQFQMWSKKLGKPLTQTLGKFDTLSLENARIKASALVKEINDGVDIENKKAEEKRARQLDPTVKEFSEVYIDRYCKPKKLKSLKEIQRILDKNILPEIGKLKMSEVNKAHLVQLLDIIEDRNAITACNRTLSVLSKLFNFALERDAIKIPPTYGMKKRGVETVRKRTLSDNEIKQLWESLDDSPISMLLKFLLVTGQRTGEARFMEWIDIDMDENLWTIPESKTKNERIHIVPLSPLAMKILGEMKKKKNDNNYVFPGRKGVLDIGSPNHYFQKSIKDFDWERTTPHDLRRTVKTRLGELGISGHIKNEVMNHERRGMDKHYDHHSYLLEKTYALYEWAILLEEIIKGKEEDNIKKGKILKLRKRPHA